MCYEDLSVKNNGFMMMMMSQASAEKQVISLIGAEQ